MSNDELYEQILRLAEERVQRELNILWQRARDKEMELLSIRADIETFNHGDGEA